jgi:hypothetical protein
VNKKIQEERTSQRQSLPKINTHQCPSSIQSSHHQHPQSIYTIKKKKITPSCLTSSKSTTHIDFILEFKSQKLSRLLNARFDDLLVYF